MAYSIRCPQCRGKFPWDPTIGWPETCPLKGCGFRIAHDRADDDIVIPFIRSAKLKAADDVYRQLEQSSEHRAQAAAEMAGCSVEDMAGLKVTNMLDARREGDVAAPPVVNDVTRMMDAAPAAVGFQGGSAQGLAFSQNVSQGAHPNMGARMRTMIQNKHADTTAAHCVGTNEFGRPVAARTDVVSDCPAAETQQPGYRRRG